MNVDSEASVEDQSTEREPRAQESSDPMDWAFTAELTSASRQTINGPDATSSDPSRRLDQTPVDYIAALLIWKKPRSDRCAEGGV